MIEPGCRLLPESTETSEIVDDPEFTVVTGNGQIYTLFRITRITHDCTLARLGWTHLANVWRVADHAMGVARLTVLHRVIIDASVEVTASQD
jgi:hypothetical protein